MNLKLPSPSPKRRLAVGTISRTIPSKLSMWDPRIGTHPIHSFVRSASFLTKWCYFVETTTNRLVSTPRVQRPHSRPPKP